MASCIEYDEVKRDVYHLLKSGISLEKLYDYNLMRALNDNITDEYEKIWTDFVDYVKKIQDGVINNEGNIIAEKYNGKKSNRKWLSSF